MPIGNIVNTLAIAIGGLLGALAGNRISDSFKENLEMIFGLCALSMGITSVILVKNMPAVVLAVILGTGIGLVLHLGQWIEKGAVAMQKGMSKIVKPKSTMSAEEANATMITVLVLFCVSGTGIYGTMVSRFSGDHSILITKSILDFFTAAIFACNLGAVVATTAIPQFLLMMVVFLGAGKILPLTTPEMINDFKACGGFLILASGLRMLKLKAYPVADMIPAMILVMPISALF